MEWYRLFFNYANLESVVWRDGGKCVIIPNVSDNHHTSGTPLIYTDRILFPVCTQLHLGPPFTCTVTVWNIIRKEAVTFEALGKK